MKLREEVLALSKEEKFDLLEALSLNLAFEEWKAGDEIEVPQWHLDILEEREREVAEGRAHYIEFETAVQLLKEKCREYKSQYSK